MLYKSVDTCHPVSLPCKGTNILLFVTCGTSFHLQPAGMICTTTDTISTPMGEIYLHARMFCAHAHMSSIRTIPMGAINFYMLEGFLHSLIPLIFSCLRCIYMQECSVHSLHTSSIPMGAMSELETCLEPVKPNNCGRNTHFRQIHFGVPNFNFKNIYMKFE